MAGMIRNFVLAFLAFTVLAGPAGAEPRSVAKLEAVSGNVLVQSQGNWNVQVVKDLPLFYGDRIVTQVGEAQVLFNDGMTLFVHNNSNLAIRETKDGVRQVVLYVGKVDFDTKGSKKANQLLTPTVSARLTGTAGTLSLDMDWLTYLLFTEGGAEILGPYRKGQAADVPTEEAYQNVLQLVSYVAKASDVLAQIDADRAAKGEISESELGQSQVRAQNAAQFEVIKLALDTIKNNPDPEAKAQARAAIEAADGKLTQLETDLKTYMGQGAEPAKPITPREAIWILFGRVAPIPLPLPDPWFNQEERDMIVEILGRTPSWLVGEAETFTPSDPVDETIDPQDGPIQDMDPASPA